MRIGVIGLGSIGLRHSRNAIALGMEVIGFDPDENRRALCEKTGCSVTGDERDIFSNCDSVIICSPNQFHFDHLKMAVDANIHALVEKPLSHKTDGLLPVLEAAAAKNLLIGVAMNLRFHPVSFAVKQVMQEGVYGRALWARFTMSSYLPAWRPHQDYRHGYTADVKTGGVLFDVIHEPDLACYILGAGNVVAASAWNTGFLDIPSEDCADIVLDHGNVRSSIHVDYVSSYKRRFFEIQCESAFLCGDLNSRSLKVYDASGAVVCDEQFSGTYDDDYIAEIECFIKAISNEDVYPCLASDSYNVLSEILKARKMAGLAGA